MSIEKQVMGRTAFQVTISLLAVICGIAHLVITDVRSRYNYEKDYLSHWELADKSSTISAKLIHITAFVDALEEGNKQREFAGHDAVFLKTPTISMRANLTAITSLRDRLSEIGSMSPSSFEYNTAIQQITAQEQGEAWHMLQVFYGCYKLASYPVAWGWICLSFVTGWSLFVVCRSAYLINQYGNRYIDGY